jgi:thiosulfate/3-mercaptopyruvate sulfurtransferase
LPAPEAFAATAGRLGIGPHDLVVAFDDAGGSFASRLWWMLRWIGHDRAAVLDGGISAWTAAGYALARPAAPVPGPALPVRLRPELSVDAPDVERARADPGVVLLDARAPDRFAGRNETIDPVAGRIPGARNAFWRDNLGPDGRVLAPEALRSHLAARLGAADPGRAICYCGSGVTACHDVLAFAVAGLPLPRLYAGSWSHWITDPARPIERG